MPHCRPCVLPGVLPGRGLVTAGYGAETGSFLRLSDHIRLQRLLRQVRGSIPSILATLTQTPCLNTDSRQSTSAERLTGWTAHL